ncbi:MAG: hypothetical protein AAGI71_02205 [Bacteroidota bacterium]
MAPPEPAAPPPLLLGTFEDDYGIAYSISAARWHQHPNATYRIVQWDLEGRYLIAQNDEANPSDGGLWTRIDWITLSDMPPYEWAFCLSAYNAPTAEEAERTVLANRDTPRTGCNGYPFSRMRRRSLGHRPEANLARPGYSGPVTAGERTNPPVASPLP